MKLKDSIIIILVFVIAVALGIFGGIKITQVKQDNNDLNQSNEVKNENNQDNNIDKWVGGDVTTDNIKNNEDYEEVTKIVDKYKTNLCGSYINELTPENKMALALINTDVSKKVYYLDSLLSDSIDIFSPEQQDGCYYGLGSTCFGSEYVNTYSYEDVLKTIRELFGSDTNILLNYKEGDVYYKYIENMESFIYTSNGVCSPRTNTSIINYEYKDNTLNVTVKNANFNGSSEQYNYTFQKEDNSYYLADITKLN